MSDCCARLAVGPDGLPTLTCLAIIRPDNSAVDVFDTRGEVRTFRTLSGLLALSFDGVGRHVMEDSQREEGGGDSQQRHEARLPVSRSMPAECNSDRLRSHLAERGYSLGQWLHYRQGRRGPSSHPSSSADRSSSSCRANRSCSLGHRIYPVRHDDHVDCPVHNSATNELHLEYHCGDCGGVDIHGRFEHVNARSWIEDGIDGGRRVDLHVYEVPTGRPFRLLDVLEGLFQLESQRVGPVRHLGLTPSSSEEDFRTDLRGDSSADVPTRKPKRGSRTFNYSSKCYNRQREPLVFPNIITILFTDQIELDKELAKCFFSEALFK